VCFERKVYFPVSRPLIKGAYSTARFLIEQNLKHGGEEMQKGNGVLAAVVPESCSEEDLRHFVNNAALALITLRRQSDVAEWQAEGLEVPAGTKLIAFRYKGGFVPAIIALVRSNPQTILDYQLVPRLSKVEVEEEARKHGITGREW
jgi:hypothetical protein